MLGKEIEDVYGPSCKNRTKAYQMHQLFCAKFYKIGFRPVTFAEEFARKAGLGACLIKDLAEVEVIEPLIYEITSVSKDTLTVLGLSGEEYTVSIAKDDHTRYVPNTCGSGKLVKYGATWHFLAPPRILHRTLTADERRMFLDGMNKSGMETYRHR